VEFSVFFIGPTEGQGSEREVLDAILREAELAEELGFDAIWLAEHHFARRAACTSRRRMPRRARRPQPGC
jgi:alkanesulfonate monooxygenase SsuD/methylene tetrahydromethanopterin reductase-like flavin-dependent oxidoreductase (luciferase family)